MNEAQTKQAMDALTRANEIRYGRAKIKRDVKAGKRNWRKVVLQPPEIFDSQKVGEFLRIIPSFGRVKVGQACKQIGVTADRRVEDLTARQRIELAHYLDEWGPGSWRRRKWRERKDMKDRRRAAA